MSNKKKQEIATLHISRENAALYADLLSLTGNQIYDKYGLKRDESYTHTAKFPGHMEMDIKLVICDGENRPYTEAVLFKDGQEVACTDCGEKLIGTWELEHEGTIYQTVISVAQ